MDIFNASLLFCHTFVVVALTFLAKRLGKEALIAWLSLLIIAMNLFILKEIQVFNFYVTPTDALTVGYMLGLNLLQYHFGQGAAKKMVTLSLFIALSYLCLTLFQLQYRPSARDEMHMTYFALLSPAPRIITASLASFFIVQRLDIAFFQKLSEIRFLHRFLISIFVCETLDTALFSLLGLYGLVPSIIHIMLFSWVAKVLVVTMISLFLIIKKEEKPHAV